MPVGARIDVLTLCSRALRSSRIDVTRRATDGPGGPASAASASPWTSPRFASTKTRVASRTDTPPPPAPPAGAKDDEAEGPDASDETMVDGDAFDIVPNFQGEGGQGDPSAADDSGDKGDKGRRSRLPRNLLWTSRTRPTTSRAR